MTSAPDDFPRFTVRPKVAPDGTVTYNVAHRTSRIGYRLAVGLALDEVAAMIDNPNTGGK